MNNTDNNTAGQFSLPISASSPAPLVLEVQHTADYRPAAAQPNLIEVKTAPAKDFKEWLARQPARFRAQMIARYPQRRD